MATEVETTKPLVSPSAPLLRASTSGLGGAAPPKKTPARISIVLPATPKRSTSKGLNRLPSSGSSMPTGGTPARDNTWSKKLILTLDGGGIRGYSALIILRALMAEVARIEKQLDPRACSSAFTDRIQPVDKIPPEVLREGEYLPCHYFDYIAGTSFGGLIAIMLGMLRMTVDDCIAEFHRQSHSIPLANASSLHRAINIPILKERDTWPTKKTQGFYDTFARFHAAATSARPASSASAAAAGSAATAPATLAIQFKTDIFQCQTMAWCTVVEDDARRPHPFCSYEDFEEQEENVGSAGQRDGGDGGSTGSKIISIPEVAKAITAPWSASFKPFKLGSGEFVDGSRQVRDPTLEVVKEIKVILDDGDGSSSAEPVIDLLLSLGTDEHHEWFYEKLRLFEGDTSGEPRQKSSAELDAEKGRSYSTYHRFEVPDMRLPSGLLGSLLGSKKRKEAMLKEIEEATQKWLTGAQQMEEICRFADVLVQRRRMRARTSMWERFALGVEYKCFHGECARRNQSYDSRGKFYDHLEGMHGRLRNVEEELDKGRRFGCTTGF